MLEVYAYYIGTLIFIGIIGTSLAVTGFMIAKCGYRSLLGKPC